MGPGSGGRGAGGWVTCSLQGTCGIPADQKTPTPTPPRPWPRPVLRGRRWSGQRGAAGAGGWEHGARRPPAAASAGRGSLGFIPQVLGSRRATATASSTARPRRADRLAPGGSARGGRLLSSDASFRSAFLCLHTARSGDQQIKTNHHYIASKSIFLHPRRFRLTRGHFKPREGGAKRPQRVPPRRPRTRLPRPLRCSARSPVIVPQRTFKTARHGSL